MGEGRAGRGRTSQTRETSEGKAVVHSEEGVRKRDEDQDEDAQRKEGTWDEIDCERGRNVSKPRA